MPTILSKIRRTVRNGNYRIGVHCLGEIAADNLSVSEVISAILNADEFDKLTDDESHVRYRLRGFSDTERDVVIVVFFVKGRLFLKTVYEASL
jgi:hypothetical protein